MAMFRYFTMKFIIDNIKNENKFDDKLPSDPSRGLFLNVKPEKKRARSLVYRLHHFFMQWPMQCKGIYQSLWRYMRNDERILCIQIIRVRYAVATSLNWLMFYSLFLYSLLIVVTDEGKKPIKLFTVCRKWIHERAVCILSSALILLRIKRWNMVETREA